MSPGAGLRGKVASQTTHGVSRLTPVHAPPAFRRVNATPDYKRRHGGKFSLTTATTLTERTRGVEHGQLVGRRSTGAGPPCVQLAVALTCL